MSKEIPLSRGQCTIVDDDDYEVLVAHKWSAYKSPKGVYYAVRATSSKNGQKRVMLRMHRVIMCCPIKFEVDQKNHNTLDNQRTNLRICTHAQNMCNRLPQKTWHGCKGVYWEQTREKWVAQIKSDGVHIHLGRYATMEEASVAYKEAAKYFFGEFVCLS